VTGSLSVAWRARALAACAVLPPLVSIASLSRIGAAVGKRPLRASAAGPDDAALSAFVDRVLRRLPPPWRYTCLRRGLVLYHLLSRAGRPVELLIGVRKDAGGALAAHAWLVKNGVPYLEKDPAHSAAFTEIARLPAPAAP
jgi:hypothetical protein